ASSLATAERRSPIRRVSGCFSIPAGSETGAPVAASCALTRAVLSGPALFAVPDMEHGFAAVFQQPDLLLAINRLDDAPHKNLPEYEPHPHPFLIEFSFIRCPQFALWGGIKDILPVLLFGRQTALQPENEPHNSGRLIDQIALSGAVLVLHGVRARLWIGPA